MESLGLFLCPENLLNFFSNLYIPPCLRIILKLMVVRLLENAFVSQKIESIPYYLCPQAKLSPRFLSLPLRKKENTQFPQAALFENLFFPSKKGEEGEETMRELKKWLKLTLSEYWSEVLINPSIFSPSTYLVSVMLCHNLDSGMPKCECSLT